MNPRKGKGEQIKRAVFAACLLGTALLFGACSRGGRSHGAGALEETGTLISMSGSHVAIMLRDYEGHPIDITQSNAKPYSPKQTCGYCHNYEVIQEGYHFQQGADELADDYGIKHGKQDFVISPGMVGKW